MKTRLLLFVMLIASLYSCTKSRYATVGPYESDDAYYTASDTYIADFALVDDEAQMSPGTDSSSTALSSDDYYDPNYNAPTVYTPNSSNNNWNADPWNSGFNSCYSPWGVGFGGYHYGSHWNNGSYFMPSVGWNPYSGYYTNYNYVYGYNPYYNPYYGSSFGYNPYNSWYTPYYSSNYYSGWAYNPWYSPYNYNATGNNDNSSGGSIVYGPRNPISSISATNSTYTGGLFYGGTKTELHTSIPANSKPGATGSANLKPLEERPSGNTLDRPVAFQNTKRPSYTPAKPQRERSSLKPGLSKPRESRPQREREVFQSKPAGKDWNYTPREEKPNRERKPIQEPTARPRSESPSRETPRTSPRSETTPSRGSGSNTSSPSRSGGGSTTSPRRK